MKKLLTFLLSMSSLAAIAQTTIYSQNFNTGSASDWTMLSGALGGVILPTGNQWLINNTYTAGPFGTTTPNQPAGITGSPNSNYLHMNCGPLLSSLYGSNCNYNAGATGETYFTVMNTPISTTGYTGVSFSFWWLCNGSAAADGKVYYRTSSSGTWTLITTPISSYYGSSTWALQTITMAAFDNKAFLEFGFEFRDQTGSDPAFGVDDIKVTGFTAASVSASMTSSSSTACQDSCITVTNTSTGTVDSARWSCPGATITTTSSSPATICFPTPGVKTVKLYLYNGGIKVDSASRTVTVNPTPHPTVTKTGTTFSVPALYTSYQWYSVSIPPIPISGATNATYTTTVTGSYAVLVDSAGCRGYAIYGAVTGIDNIAGEQPAFWCARSGNGDIFLHSATEFSAPVTVNIFDVTGRLIRSEIWNKEEQVLQLKGLTLRSGMYVIRLNGNNISSVLKWQQD